ncbi:nucleotidyltransferase domain-containing protein [Ornithinibacillus salinisoli]|uniref:Nucleotidyltransferase domain-containing protein n=1 Tax=Ornithinibacillus salinisoli TaxID=1848459 RepID=A0ABW4VUL2_9BACI
MNEKSFMLLETAKKFINQLNLDIMYASIGGSVGRGNADEFSDIDLTVYTKTIADDIAQNISFHQNIIQLDIKHTDELPNKERIIASPWNYRFLYESAVIEDTGNRFAEIKDWAVNYYSSIEGRKHVIEQVCNIVKERTQHAFNSLKKGKHYSATIAATGSWTESALLFLFINCNSVDAGKLIREIQNVEDHYNTVKIVSPFFNEVKVKEIIHIMKQFRYHLRNQAYSFEFGIDEIQDLLFEMKAKRLCKKDETVTLLWQAYSEALWLYFETSNGLYFDDYFEMLPKNIRQGLSRIGFTPLKEEQIKILNQLSDDLLNLCKNMMK